MLENLPPELYNAWADHLEGKPASMSSLGLTTEIIKGPPSMGKRTLKQKTGHSKEFKKCLTQYPSK